MTTAGGVEDTVLGELTTGVVDDNSKVTPLMRDLGGVFGWMPEDDERLTFIMSNFTSRHHICNKNMWSSIADMMGGGKTDRECYRRWNLYLAPPKKNTKKKRFTAQADAVIMSKVVNCEKARPCWVDIAKLVNEPDGNRIRERWNNVLNPKLNHLPFSKEEDVRLYEGLQECGPKWTSIARKFFNSTRSDIQLKNRYKTVTFKQFYARVSTRVLKEERGGKATKPGATNTSKSFDNRQSMIENELNDIEEIQVAPYGISDSTHGDRAKENEQRLAKRLKVSTATKVLQEDIPRPPSGQMFTPFGASQILSRISKSERRSIMQEWIAKNYVPVNLTSLYRALERYRQGKKLKPKWYCEGRTSKDCTEKAMNTHYYYNAESPNATIKSTR